jgi:hypothetical protein
MDHKHKPKAGSYEASLTEEERFALHSLLLSDAFSCMVSTYVRDHQRAVAGCRG